VPGCARADDAAKTSTIAARIRGRISEALGRAAVTLANSRSPAMVTKSSPTISASIHPKVQVGGSVAGLGIQRKDWMK
jgi:hypothetical protein